MLGSDWLYWNCGGPNCWESWERMGFDGAQRVFWGNSGPATVGQLCLQPYGGIGVLAAVKGGSHHCLFVAPLAGCRDAYHAVVAAGNSALRPCRAASRHVSRLVVYISRCRIPGGGGNMPCNDDASPCCWANIEPKQGTTRVHANAPAAPI